MMDESDERNSTCLLLCKAKPFSRSNSKNLGNTLADEYPSICDGKWGCRASGSISKNETTKEAQKERTAQSPVLDEGRAAASQSPSFCRPQVESPGSQGLGRRV